MDGREDEGPLTSMTMRRAAPSLRVTTGAILASGLAVAMPRVALDGTERLLTVPRGID